MWAGRVRGNGQEQMSQRANQLAVYVCACMQQDQSIFCKRAYTHTLHLARSESHPSKDHLDSATALTVALRDEMLQNLYILVSSIFC